MPAHVSRQQIRWVDMDAYRHVNNTVYLRYCEQARIEMMAFPGSAESTQFGPDPEAAPDAGVVLATLDMAYHRPLVYRDHAIVVQSWVIRIGSASTDIVHRIVSPDDLSPQAQPYASAATTMVAVHKEAGRSRPWTTQERAMLTGYLDPTLSIPARRS